VVRDKDLPTPDRRKARRGTARGGASARKRGAARLTVVEDPGDAPGSGISGGELPDGGSSYDWSLWGESPGGRGTAGTESGNLEPGGPDPGGEEAARLICLRLLTGGPRTRAQLATALRKRRIPDEVANCVLGRFAEVGLIDDAAFARAWVESRHHGRGLARKALAAELRQRGVADGEVRSAVGLLGPQDELATAQRLVARRVAASRGKPMPARARQLMSMLARKGYPAGLAAQVVREALEQDQADGGSSTDLAWISEDGSGDDWS
jgi:regulatory protein